MKLGSDAQAFKRRATSRLVEASKDYAEVFSGKEGATGEEKQRAFGYYSTFSGFNGLLDLHEGRAWEDQVAWLKTWAKSFKAEGPGEAEALEVIVEKLEEVGFED